MACFVTIFIRGKNTSEIITKNFPQRWASAGNRLPLRSQPPVRKNPTFGLKNIHMQHRLLIAMRR